MRQIRVVVQTLQHLHGGARACLIGNAQHRVECFDGNPLQLQGNADEAAYLGQALRCHAGSANGIGRAIGDAANQDAMTLRKRKRQFSRLVRVLKLCVHGGGVAGGSGTVNCAGGFGVAPCGFVVDGGGAGGNAIPEGMGGTSGWLSPGSSGALPPVTFCCMRLPSSSVASLWASVAPASRKI